MPTATPTAPVVLPPRHRPPRKRGRTVVLVGLLVVLVGAATAVAGLRLVHRLPATRPAAAAGPVVALTLPDTYTIPGSPPAVPWPAQGQAALEVVGVGSLG